MPRLMSGNEKGFTFLNALFGIIVLLTVLPLIVLFFGFAHSYSADLNAKHLEWQLFTEDLQSYLAQIDSVEVTENGSGIRIWKQGEEIDIEKFGNLIRKQRFNLGHEIMLTNMEDCTFQIQGSSLKIQVNFTNGAVEQAEYVIPFSQ